jgi:hypothetical protein
MWEEMWSDRFKEETKIFQVFNHVRECNEGVFQPEILERIPDVNEGTLSMCLNVLIKRKMISKSDKLLKVPTGGIGYIYGINEDVIRDRIRRMMENPEYDNGTLRSKIFYYLKKENSGFTPVEIKISIKTKSTTHSVSNECWKMFRDGLIKRSPFRLPNRLVKTIGGKNVNITGNMSVVYGIDMESVFRGIFRLMPQTVKTSLNYIQCSDVVYPSWKLTESTKVSNENLKNWFKKGLCRMGLVEYKTLGNVTYYYNPRIPDGVVDEQISKLREESRKWRLRITELGRMFERKSVWTYVEYLRSKNYDIKTSEGFPEKVPSYKNSKVREKYVREYTDENGNEKVEWLNDVWKFDSEPVDYLIFVKDKNTGERTVHILTCKRDVCKRFGINYFVNFIGCIRMGRTRDGLTIPGFLTSRPVFVCGEIFGRKLHQFNENNMGQAGTILTIEKMEKMLESMGKVYPKQREFERMLETKKAYDMYSQHEDVLLEKKDVFEMLKERGFKVSSNVR